MQPPRSPESPRPRSAHACESSSSPDRIAEGGLPLVEKKGLNRLQVRLNLGSLFRMERKHIFESVDPRRVLLDYVQERLELAARHAVPHSAGFAQWLRGRAAAT